MLPTLCDLVGIELPERPLDGISLEPLIEGKMQARPEPICFWSYGGGAGSGKPYIDPKLQEGTTPLVKMMAGRYTRNFRNVQHPRISDQDYRGPRVILDNRYKLVIHDRKQGEPRRELFDIREDPAEKQDLAAERPEIVEDLSKQLHAWQDSVLRSLTGADYR
jgi:arylsulfatase A-like enzyme